MPIIRITFYSGTNYEGEIHVVELLQQKKYYKRFGNKKQDSGGNLINDDILCTPKIVDDPVNNITLLPDIIGFIPQSIKVHKVIGSNEQQVNGIVQFQYAGEYGEELTCDNVFETTDPEGVLKDNVFGNIFNIQRTFGVTGGVIGTYGPWIYNFSLMKGGVIINVK